MNSLSDPCSHWRGGEQSFQVLAINNINDCRFREVLAAQRFKLPVY
jgi:hypothetical protein